MSTKMITRLIMGITILSLIAVIFWFQYGKQNQSSQKVQIEEPIVQETSSQDEKKETTSTDRLGDIEDEIEMLSYKIEDQENLISQITEESNSSDEDISTVGKQVLSVAQSKVNSFSTTSSAYTSMGNFSNISCPEDCSLWINFYTVSSNDSSNNTNTYGLFVDGVDQGTYSQGTIQNSSSTIPVSMNTVVSTTAGTHTVEIKSKTSGGTLTSQVANLQVIAIER